MIVYGPRTVFCLALKDFPGCHEFLLLDDGTWQHVKETTQINEGKMFSPGNLRATQDNPEYSKLVDFWLKEKYTLRYTGGMVPDVFQIIVKEKGVFSNVTSPTTVAKLRILFEVAPLALLVEKAGGASSCDGQQLSGLDPHHRVGPAHPDLLRLRRRGEALRGVHVRLRPALLLRGPRPALVFLPGRRRAGPPTKKAPPPIPFIHVEGPQK